MRPGVAAPRAERILSFPQLLVLLAVALSVFTALFGIWTASSVWSFPRFLIAVLFCIYFPGKLVLDVAGVQTSPLEDLTLSVVLGMTASSIVYWVLAYLALEQVFVLFAFAVAIAYLYRGRRRWRGIWSYRVSIEAPHILLLAVIILALIPLGVLPTYYRNADLLSGSSMTYARRPFDVAQHLSFAYELTHSVPPEVPFFSGETLDYHYGMDLLAAMLSRTASLSVLDLTVRFLPTLFLVTAILAIFCFSRSWLGSGYGAVLVAFLVVFGEDLSFIPGLVLGSRETWSAQFFGVPTIYSLYALNPMLPSLGLLFGGMLCLGKSRREESARWSVLAAFLFAMIAGYKVFASVHVLASLAMAGAILFLFRRETRLLKVLVMTMLLGAPLFLNTLIGSQTGARMWVRIDPWPYLPEALEQMGLLESSVGSEIGAIYLGGPVSAAGIAGLFLVALPWYLLGSLGVRVMGIPVAAKELFSIRHSTGLRLFTALFVLLGPLMTLTLTATPWGYPAESEYNNAVWFYVQSKYVMWIFVAEMILILGSGKRRLVQALAVTAVVGLSLPSAIQYFHSQTSYRAEVLSEAELDLMHYLQHGCTQGEVVLSHDELAEHVVALTPCRVPVVSPGTYTHLFVSGPALERREEDMASFWDAWREEEFRSDIAERYEVAYVVIDRASLEFAALQSSWQNDSDLTPAGQLRLDPCFENAGYVVYETRHNDCGD